MSDGVSDWLSCGMKRAAAETGESTDDASAGAEEPGEEHAAKRPREGEGADEDAWADGGAEETHEEKEEDEGEEEESGAAAVVHEATVKTEAVAEDEEADGEGAADAEELLDDENGELGDEDEMAAADMDGGTDYSTRLRADTQTPAMCL